jgi:hypothetical protein
MVFFSARESSRPWVGSPTRGHSRLVWFFTDRSELGCAMRACSRRSSAVRGEGRGRRGGEARRPLCLRSAVAPGGMAQWCTVDTSSRSCSVSVYRAFHYCTGPYSGTIALRATRPLERTLSLRPLCFRYLTDDAMRMQRLSIPLYSRQTRI